MTDRNLVIDATTLPLDVSAGSQSLLAVCDPFLAAALPYFQHLFVTRLSDAFAQVMIGRSAALSNKACVETSPIDPGPFLGTNALRLPLLALYPVSGRESERTMHKAKIESLYRLAYILPALGWEESKRVAPLLMAAIKLVTLGIEEGGVSDYQDNARVWGDGIASAVRVLEHRIGPVAEAEDTRMAHYALSADISVELVESYDTTNATALEYFTTQLDLNNGEDPALEGFIEARSDVG